MSIAATLERHVREHVVANLESARILLTQAIQDGIPQAAQAAQGTAGEITGQLRAGILVDAWTEQGNSYTSTARSLAFYSEWLEFGTGIYGPRGGRIYPQHAKALSFFWHARGGRYLFKSVRGTRPFNFFYQPMPDRFHSALVDGFGI